MGDNKVKQSSPIGWLLKKKSTVDLLEHVRHGLEKVMVQEPDGRVSLIFLEGD